MCGRVLNPQGGWHFGASLLSIIVVALGSLGCGGGDSAPATRKDSAAPSPTREQGEVKGFSLLRSEPEQLPSQLVDELRGIGTMGNLAQRLPIVTPQFWVVPAHGRLCLVESADRGSGNFACSQLFRVLREGTFIASVPSGAPGASRFRTVVGLVPDGVTRVRIHASKARPISVRVTENVFALRDEGRAFPESIELVRGK
ncbi:MAG: hypothetical protein QOF06_1739 [Solirubrobacterales bacterium]|nr:hypothetical protein [Solirubrobacterales bacterium]